jgi:hypothetical protein
MFSPSKGNLGAEDSAEMTEELALPDEATDEVREAFEAAKPFFNLSRVRNQMRAVLETLATDTPSPEAGCAASETLHAQSGSDVDGEEEEEEEGSEGGSEGESEE